MQPCRHLDQVATTTQSQRLRSPSDNLDYRYQAEIGALTTSCSSCSQVEGVNRSAIGNLAPATWQKNLLLQGETDQNGRAPPCNQSVGLPQFDRMSRTALHHQ